MKLRGRNCLTARVHHFSGQIIWTGDHQYERWYLIYSMRIISISHLFCNTHCHSQAVVSCETNRFKASLIEIIYLKIKRLYFCRHINTDHNICHTIHSVIRAFLSLIVLYIKIYFMNIRHDCFTGTDWLNQCPMASEDIFANSDEAAGIGDTTTNQCTTVSCEYLQYILYIHKSSWFNVLDSALSSTAMGEATI